jgi:hypothetical protein
MDSVDGLRPPSLTTGAAATSVPSISRLMAFITPVSSLTNSCPEKPGAAHGVFTPTQARDVAKEVIKKSGDEKTGSRKEEDDRDG